MKIIKTIISKNAGKNNKRTTYGRPVWMQKIFATAIAIGMTALLAVQQASAQVTLTGVNVFSTGSSGSASGGTVWNTLGGDSTVDLFLISGTNYASGSFINGPNDSDTAINIPLTSGIYTYAMLAGQNPTGPY